MGGITRRFVFAKRYNTASVFAFYLLVCSFGGMMHKTNIAAKRLSPDQIARIQRCDGSLRRVARELGIGKSTVDYHRQKLYREWDRADPDEENESATIEFERLAKPQRCPVHGLLHVWPCVICATNQTNSRYE